MEVIVAKTAGFCFGVDKAVGRAYDLLDKADKPIYTMGPIIHNEQVVNNLKEKGVKVIESADDLDEVGNIVIRAHGVTPQVYNQLIEKGMEIIDATCPYVKKIHRLVKEKFVEGYQIIIIGDSRHPEVIGINGWCENKAFTVNSKNDVEQLPEIVKPICVVAQTTITSEKWNEINECLMNRFDNIIKFDTICNATSMRQAEAADIARVVDMMIVIGGKNSSNTQKLFEICKKYCTNTISIETSGDFPPVDINKINKIGITAGASTPAWIIKEVKDKMSELDTQENEVSFKEVFENSIVTLHTGQTVKGRIIGFNNSEVYVDLGFKSDGIVPIEEFSDDPDFDPQKSLKIGDEIDVFVIRVNDGEGNVILSKRKVDVIKGWDKMEKAFEDKTTISAKVIEVVNGGVIATSNGVRVFIPASQISDKYTKDLSEFLKQTLNIRLIEYNKQKKRFVGSSRVILEEEKSRKSSEVWENIEVGKTYKGTVKSLTDFGAFVDIGGVDGLIHLSELSWNKISHPSQVLKEGDIVEVRVIDFDKEKKRISLGYKKTEDNPWHNIDDKYQIDNIVTGKVVRLVPFGAFVELEKGVDALVHISQISSVRIARPHDVLHEGQIVEAKITEVNAEAKKISLSIKDVRPIDPVSSSKEEATEAPEDAPSEHKEEMNVSIGDVLENSEGKANE